MQQPTAEQCDRREKVFEDETRIGHALWYPQMGGYCARAMALVSKEQHGCRSLCVDVLVWHNGEFPFDGEGGRQPVELHHCDPGQFITLGEQLGEFIASAAQAH